MLVMQLDKFGMRKMICLAMGALMGVMEGCSTAEGEAKAEQSAVAQGQEARIQVPYRQADNYFVRNDVDSIPHKPISSQEEFDELFGAAAFMGKDGKPTEIDFDKEYAIAIALAPTNMDVSIVPAALEQDPENGDITFSYRVETAGEAPRSFEITPCLILVVSKDHEGRVIYEEMK